MIGQFLSAPGNMLSGYLSSQANKRAIAKQIDALRNMEQADPVALGKAATEGDKAQIKAGYDYQRENDPVMASIRDAAYQGMLKATQDLNAGVGPAGEAIAAASAATQQASADMAGNSEFSKMISQLLTGAQEDLASGSTLSPEFQSELVRSGLEQGGAGGFSAGSGIVGRNVRGLFGQAGEALKTQRQQRATQAAGTAANLRTGTISNTLGAAGQLSNLGAQKVQQLAGAGATAESLVPRSIGISGDEVANLMLRNLSERNQRAGAIAQLEGAKDLNQASMWGGLIGSAQAGMNSLVGG